MSADVDGGPLTSSYAGVGLSARGADGVGSFWRASGSLDCFCSQKCFGLASCSCSILVVEGVMDGWNKWRGGEREMM